MYAQQVLSLINSAERSIYMQTQYIHPSNKDGQGEFNDLIQALSDAYLKRGLDVRLITSQYETAQWIEKLKPFGLDKILKIQQRVHNKGIVVDSKTVLISSQNWSADGVLFNRDAGVIIYNENIAQYFEKIFLFDWVNQAHQKVYDPSYPTGKSSKHKSKKLNKQNG